jgi:hypothetical protein
VAGEVFFAWVPEAPNVRVSPDGFVCDDRKLPRRGVVCTWKPGRRPPRFALEVVSEDRKKDYLTAPQRYAALGTRELAVFDPAAVGGRRSIYKHPLTLFRRLADGSMRRVYEGNGPARSEELGAWLLKSEVEGQPCLRIARDAAARDLVETPEDAQRILKEKERSLRERERSLRAKEKSLKEKAQARADAERSRAESERARADAAERRLRALERRLRRTSQEA